MTSHAKPAASASTASSPAGSAFLPRREIVDEAVVPAAPPQLGSPQNQQEIRLLLHGDSVVDWHRLMLSGPDDVRRLLRVNSIDVDNPKDLARLESLRSQAVRYLTESLGLRLDPHVATAVSCLELLLLASGKGRWQRQACTLLKVMHIIYHLDARELRTALSIPDRELHALVEHSIVAMFDELRAAGVPVVEFAWSHKTKESLITKLLVKRETSAARVFDRLRFRVIVERAEDIVPTLQVMLHSFIPFNYVVPGQTVNSLIDTSSIDPIPRGRDLQASEESNEFSGEGYRVLNFVADLPVRVDALLVGTPFEGGAMSVVFVLTEFQIIDRAQARSNEEGESSHAQYKHRQHQRVRERLLRGPRKGEGEGAGEDPFGSAPSEE
jgi:uncharacterized protein (TIGR04552 family)